MVSEGDDAPKFTAPLATGDIEEFTLAEALENGAPVVLAFFPGAFTPVCRNELSTFEDRIDELDGVGATLYGISIDTPFALNEFRDRLSLSFDLISDVNRSIIDVYEVTTAAQSFGIDELAQRSVFVIDESGTVEYVWVADDLRSEPDYDQVIAAVETA